jgi:predicted DNA-binding protein
MRTKSFRIPAETNNRLKAVSNETDRTQSSIIKRAINEYLDRLEHELLTQKQISQLLAGKSASVLTGQSEGAK